jgi:4-cresol dehydrogenase (hydroxylating)
MKGIPTNTQIDSSYWRKKSLPSGAKNPDLDRCGLIWCAPVAPLTGKATKEITQIIAQTIVQHEFEPLISMTLITERSLCCVSTIAYDRETPGEDIKAIACHQQLLDRLSDAGYYPYRLGIQSMDVLTKRQDNYQNLLNRLKKSLDPNQILAPDRYCP